MLAAIWLLLATTCAFVAINLAQVALRNRKAHAFFRTRARGLPVHPEAPRIFSGHLKQVIARDHNVKAIDELHALLGPTFGFYRCEQPWVLTKNLDLIKLIELDKPHRHLDRAHFNMPFSSFDHSIFQQNGDKWRRARRVLSAALTNRRVRSDDATRDIESVLEQVRAAIERQMDTESGRETRSMILAPSDMFQRLSLAVIFLVMYRRENEVQFGPEPDPWVARIEEAARRIENPFMAAAVMFPFLKPLVTWLIRLHPVGRMDAQLVNYVQGAADLRGRRTMRDQGWRETDKTSDCSEKGMDDDHDDHDDHNGENRSARVSKSGGLAGNGFRRRLVDTIIEALFDKRLTYEEFVANTQFLLLAGFQTTADTIACLVWQLARNPAVQEKLRASIHSEGLDSEYLHWCIKESIRYHPSVPLGVGRVLGEDVHVRSDNGSELFLPKGAFVMPSTYAIHHDPAIWPEPERFWPERWAQAASFHAAAFMGFGLGPRNCVGYKLAMHEIKLAARMLLANYRIEPLANGATPDEWAFSAPGMIFTTPDVLVKVRLVSLAGPHVDEAASAATAATI